MPTQTDVQQLIQGLAPGSVNNGNPNTIYNSPWTVTNNGGSNQLTVPYAYNAQPYQNLAPIPMSTANGQWMLPQIAVPQTGQSWAAPFNTPLNLPRWMLPTNTGSNNPGGGGTPGGGTNPPPTGGPNPPVNTGGGGGGGGGTPDPNPGGGTGTTVFGDGGPFNQSFSIYDPVYQSVWGNSNGPNVNSNDMNSFLSHLTNSQMSQLAGLKNQDGSFDWAQALDMITEPWFQSNMYLSGLDSWDTSNILAGLAQAITGLPWNDLMNALGQQQAYQEDPQNWLERQLVDHWRDNVSNDFANYSNQLSTLINTAAAGGNQTGTANTIYDFYNMLMGGRLNNISGVIDNSEGCVTLDSHIKDFGRAGDVKVGDELTVIDPVTFEETKAKVSYSESKSQPTVRIVTKSGVVLECSKSAPICDDTGEQVRAENLLGCSIPIKINDEIEFDTVMEVEDLGEQLVQHITCENNFFLAGKKEGAYLLHHNIKKGPDSTYNNWMNGGGGSWAGALGSVFGGGSSGGSSGGSGGLGGGGYYGTGGTFGSFGF